MDLNFHYYAVKTLAIRAGFTEEQGQTIANYSQFVDDFTSYRPILLDDVPEYARHLAMWLGILDKWVFFPVTTGFESWFDMARLITDGNQRAITVPFHFIPPQAKLDEEKNGNERTALRVVPARMDTPSQIRDLMLEAQKAFEGNRDDRTNLIRIGMLLHIFADTYAHQNFSGFWGWENHCLLKKVTDNTTKQDCTSLYFPKLYHLVPGIGHPEANHAPDDSNVTFEVVMKSKEGDAYDITYKRNNTEEFCVLAREVINFFSRCLGKEPLSESEWNRLVPQLKQGFLSLHKDAAMLNDDWKKIFPDIEYSYDKEHVMNALLEKHTDANSLPNGCRELIGKLSEQGIEVEPAVYRAKSDEYFRYNVLASAVRAFVKAPDTGKEQMEKLKQLCDINMNR